MHTFLAACTALLAANPLPVHRTSAADFEPLAKHIRHVKQVTAYPSGTAVVVVKDGRILYQGYFGLADMQARTPVTRDTVFYIASATKPFFALDLLLKQASGELDTRMSLQQMFPAMRFGGIDADRVTLRDLLVHTSGIDNPPLAWATAYSGVHDPRSLRRLVAASYPDADTRLGQFRYSNVGYNIASVWVDRRFATSWQQQLEHTVLAPLGMHHTGTSIERAKAAGWTLAKPYSWIAAEPRVPLYLRKHDDTMQAAGGMVSTAADLGRFLIAELSPHDSPFPHAVIAQSQTPQAQLQAHYLGFPRTGYAWGWYLGPYMGHTMLHHFGSFAGFHAHLSFMPDAGIGLVVLNNEDFLGARLTDAIADAVYGTLLHRPGIQTEIDRRFAALASEALAIPGQAARRRAAIAARPWRLTLPRRAYAGRYRNALLGDLHVQIAGDGRMHLQWGRLASVATPGVQPDQVRVEFVPGSGNFLAFRVAGDAATTVTFEHMVFERVP